MITSPHIGEGVDGTLWRIAEMINSPIPIVPISRISNFKFNEELRGLKDYVLLDYCEYDWDWPLEESGTHLFGQNTTLFPHFRGSEWEKFDDWVYNNSPRIYFKRELLKEDFKENVVPVDYPSFAPPYEIQDEKEFNSRPIDALFYWGRSHEARLKLHSNIWKAASEKGFSVCDNIYYFENFMKHEAGRKFISFNIPHFARHPLNLLLYINGQSKISIALPGAGIKTFRHSESPTNSVMLKYKDNLAWSYPWDETNCILCEEGKELEAIEEALNNPNLYEIYVNGVRNLANYQADHYILNYIEKKINEL